TNSPLITCPDKPSGPLSLLAPFFKCSPVDRATERTISCSFATDTRSEYTVHLKRVHKGAKFTCLYCQLGGGGAGKEPSLFVTPIALLRHIATCHKHRFFQCSLCPYRAITADHVNVHQTVQHPDQSPLVLLCRTPSLKDKLQLRLFYDRFKVDRLAP